MYFTLKVCPGVVYMYKKYYINKIIPLIFTHNQVTPTGVQYPLTITLKLRNSFLSVVYRKTYINEKINSIHIISNLIHNV